MMYEVEDSSPLDRALVASERIPVDTSVMSLASCAELDAPTKYSVYAGENVHLDDSVLACLNHSCDPNVFVDTERREVRAMREIRVGEVLSFFYPSTEWTMAYPFACRCDAEECIGLVDGAAAVPPSVLARHRLNRHVAEMLACPETDETARVLSSPPAPMEA